MLNVPSVPPESVTVTISGKIAFFVDVIKKLQLGYPGLSKRSLNPKTNIITRHLRRQKRTHKSR